MLRFFRPFLRTALFAAFAASAAAQGNAGQCVEAPKSGAAPADFSVGASRDWGNISQIEFSGDYARGLTAPRQAITQRFLETHPDRYDFLIVFTTFEFPTGDAVAFYNPVRNDVGGIGQAVFDHSAAYGSAGRLQGYIDMAALRRYVLSLRAPEFENLRNTLAHELMHRWGAGVSYHDAQGQPRGDLRGRDGTHWSYFLDSDASLMYGNDWERREDGRYASRNVTYRYSALDLYLAGFAAAEEVAPMDLIRGGDGNAVDMPRLGAISAGSAESVRIEQIIAAEGPRQPGVAAAQKEFRAALIVLTRPQENIPADTLAALENLRVRAQQHFAQVTNGRGTLRIYNEMRETAQAQLPAVLEGSGDVVHPGGISAALDWLRQRQLADGRWQDRPATALRDTAAVIELLQELDPAYAGLARARSWLTAQAGANHDQQSARLVLDGDAALATKLIAAQSADGGWGLAAGFQDSVTDTALVAAALAGRESGAGSVRAALQQLAARQNGDGSFALGAQGRGHMLPTLYAVRAFAQAPAAQADPVIAAASAWLQGKIRPGGGYGDDETSLADSIELSTLARTLQLPAGADTALHDFLAQRQQLQGDWQGSVYLTARAALAQMRAQRANLRIDGALSAVPAAPLDGDLLTLGAVVHNSGGISTPASSARWFDGDPAQGSTPLGSDIAVPALIPGARFSISQHWDSSGHAGARQFWLQLDAAEAIDELNESDNLASLALDIAPIPTQPDLELRGADLILNPASVTQLPTTVQLSGSVRNLGAAAASDVRLRLLNETTAQVLAETTLAVAARSSSAFTLQFNVATAATLKLRLVADPDNQTAEARETNNQASLILPYGPSLDLEVLPAGLSLADANPPQQGRDVNFRIVAHNRGTQDSPPFQLLAQLHQGAVTSTLLDQPVQIPAGTSIERRVSWRAQESGPAQLTVQLDASNQLAELREDNNTAQFDFTVATPDKPDLIAVPDSLGFAPEPALQGQPLTASLLLRNAGAAAGAFKVALYAADPRQGGTRLAETSLAGLAAGAETLVNFAIPALDLRYDTPLFAVVDADLAIEESDETNNLLLRQLPVRAYADISVSSAAIELQPSAPVPGAPLQAVVRVRNIGGQAAQDVRVQLREGDAVTGVLVAPEQTIAEFAPGAEAVLQWNWNFGLQPGVRQLSVLADAGATVRENVEENNIAILPVALQDQDFYASEGYFSPNGDGVRDRTSLVFRRTAAAQRIEIRNAAGRTVRSYDSTASNEGSDQVNWDGHNMHGRVVPDGIYYPVLLTAGVETARTVVVVDTDRSSFIAAIGSPLLLETKQPRPHWFHPPASSELQHLLFSNTHPLSPHPRMDGLYRSSALAPALDATVSSEWVEQRVAFEVGAALPEDHLLPVDASNFSPDGQWVVFGLFNHGKLELAVAATTQTNKVRVLDADVTAGSPVGGAINPRFIDSNHVIAGVLPQLYIYNLDSGGKTPLRSLPADTQKVQVFSHGLYLWTNISNSQAPSHYAPLDAQRPMLALPRADGSRQFRIMLNEDGEKALVYRFGDSEESVSLFSADATPLRVLQHRTPQTFAYPLLASPSHVRSLQAQWVSRDGSVLLIDAAQRRVRIFERSGQQRSSAQLPPPDSQLDLGPPDGSFIGPSERIEALYEGSTCVSAAVDCEASQWLVSEPRRQWFDPVQREITVVLTSEYVGVAPCEAVYCFDRHPATLEAFAVDIDSGTFSRVLAGQRGADLTSTLRPRYVFGDGARLAHDGRHARAGTALSFEAWAPAENIAGWYQDAAPFNSGDDGVLLGLDNDARVRRNAASLANLTAQIWAGSSGRAIQLHGFATDLNFAYYQLDWTKFSGDTDWHAITPPMRDPVIGGEFLSWIPPEPGQYRIRLSVVDKAGNRVVHHTAAVSQHGTPISTFELEPRYFSPNGDGVKDTVSVHYSVRQTAEISVRVLNDQGRLLHEQTHTLDAGRHSFSWDGRDQQGQLQPDGVYRIDVAGVASSTVLDTTPPLVSGEVLQPFRRSPITGAVPWEPGVRFAAEDANLDTSYLQAAAHSSNEWQDAAMSSRVSFLAGKDFRVVALDLAGNRRTLELGAMEDHVRIIDCSNVCEDPVPGSYPRRSQPAPERPVPDTFPDRHTIVVEDPAKVELFLQDVSAGLAAIEIETANADAPGIWSVLSHLPGTAPPFVFDKPGDRALRLVLPLHQLPAGSDIYLRPVGIRSDGSRVPGNQIRLLMRGIGQPNILCYSPTPDLSIIPLPLQELVQAQNPAQIQVFVQTFVPGLSEPLKLAVAPSSAHLAQGIHTQLQPVARNAHGAVFLLQASSMGGTASYGAGAVNLAGNRVMRGEIASLSCSYKPGDEHDELETSNAMQVDPQCGSLPTGQGRVSFMSPAELPFASALVTAGSQESKETLLNEFPVRNDATAGSPYGWRLDLPIATAQRAPGTLRVDATINRLGAVKTGIVYLPIDHTPPLADLDEPASGSRFCATRKADKQALRFAGRLRTDTAAEWQIELFHPELLGGSYSCIFNDANRTTLQSGRCPVQNELHPTTDADFQVTVEEQLNSDGNGGFSRINGPVQAQLRTADWSGATVCSNSAFYLDSAVELGEAALPQPQIGQRQFSVHGADLPEFETVSLGLSRNGSPRYRNVTVSLLAGEPLNYTISLHAIDAARQLGPELQQLGTGNAISGNFGLSWDGQVNGSPAADGFYAIVIRATDSCGWKAARAYLVDVDSTGPELALTEPAAGSVLNAATTEVRGTVDDVHFGSFDTAQPYWQLGVRVGGSPLQLINEQDYALPQAALLGHWNRGDAQGTAQFALLGVDDFGNTSEIALPFSLGTPLRLLGAARLQPALFSPNGDGRLDQTRLSFDLLAAARVDVTISGPQGSLVAQLASDRAFDPGTATLNWDGAAAADGEYIVTVTARDPAQPALSESARLALGVDTTPPGVLELEPAQPFARQGAIALRLDEAHLDRYDIRLLDAAGKVVAQDSGAQSGRRLLGRVENLADGDYRLEILAQDRAGNRRELAHPFQVDRVAPELALDTPPQDQVLPRAATAVAINGSATDTNFARYDVDIAHAGQQDWNNLGSGTSAVSHALLAHWLVQQADGDYQLRLRAEDQAGNSTELLRAVGIDGTPPLAQISAPQDGAAVSGALRVLGSASDTYLQDYQLAVATPDDAAAGRWTPVFRGVSPVSDGELGVLDLALAEGDYRLRLRVNDRAGHSATAVAQFRIDRSPPPVPLQLRVRLAGADAQLDWNAVAAGDLAGYAVYRNGERINPQLAQQPRHVDAAIGDGHWRYHVSAIDPAGNESAPSNSVQLDVDRTPPLVMLQSPRSDERLGGIRAVVGSAYSLDDDFGSWELSVRRADGSGAVQSLARSGLPQQNQPLLQWDTRSWAEDSALILRLAARDRSGNEAIAEVPVRIDNLAPAAPTGLSAVLAGADAQVSWNANAETDLLGYVLYRNGRPVNGGAQLPADLRVLALSDTGYLDAALADGTHQYVVHAIDRAGNLSPPSQPASVGPLDNGPPRLQIDTPEEGHAFEQSLEIRASSADQDIASVEFAYRAAGAGTWTALQPVLATAPYQITWNAQGLPPGDYEIRALAQDSGGLSDPQPPQRRVRLADLTAPSPPLHVRARGDGGGVRLEWLASTAADVSGYRIERWDGGSWQLAGDTIDATTFSDTGLDDGTWRYRVRAKDAAGNLSGAVEDTAFVFGLTLEQPYTPTSAAQTALQGRGARPGSVEIRVENGAGNSTLPALQSGADARFSAAAIALQPGENRLRAQISDSLGNRSREAEVWLQQGQPPSAPGGLAASAQAYAARLDWNLNPEADVIGYRVQRNGRPLAADQALGGLGAESGLCCDTPFAVDGDPATAWSFYAGYAALEEASALDPALEIGLDQPQLLTALQLDWRSAAEASGNVDIYARTPRAAWVRIARLRGAAAAHGTAVFEPPYRSDRLRMVVRSPGGHAMEVPLALAELRLMARPLKATPPQQETLLDGLHSYRVSAVNALGFESALSVAAELAIGDATGPDAVELSGTLDGNSAQLSWSASAAADLARYELSRDGSVIANLPAQAPRSHTDANLMLGEHRYQVIAYDSYGNAGAPSNEITLVVAGEAPQIPQNVQVTRVPAGGALDVSWQPPAAGPAVAAYALRRGDSAAGPFVELSTAATLARRDAGLVNGRSYYYTVQSIDAAGNRSPQSAPVSGTPRDEQGPPAPLLTWPTRAGQPLQTGAGASAVCGLAEAGSLIDLERDGVVLGQARAAAADSYRSTIPAGLTNEIRAAADGVHVSGRGSDDRLRIVDLSTQASEALSDTARLAQWSARGGTLYYADGSRLLAQQPGVAAVDLGFALDELRRYAVGSDDNQVLLYGAPAGAADGVWLLRRDGTAPRRYAVLDGHDLLDTAPLLAPDLRHALLATPQSLLLLDLRSGELRAEIPADSAVAPSWAADSRRFAHASGIGGNYRLEIYDAIALQPLSGTTLAQPASRVAWSPDDSQVAVAADGRIGLYAADSGLPLPAPPFNLAINDAESLAWTASGTLLFHTGTNVGTFTPAGWFCSTPLPLRPGDNRIGASAVDDAGNRGPAAAPLLLQSAAALPDLALSSADLFFVPAAPAPGQAVTALATLRNTGQAAVAVPTLAVQLIAPDGSMRTIALAAPLPALAPGGARQVTLGLGTLEQSGYYRLRLEADPEQQLNETREDNNRAEAALAVTASADPLLDLSLAASLFRPGETVRGEVRVSNPGREFGGGRVRLEIVDAQEWRVADLGEISVPALDHAQQWQQVLNWDATGVLAGDYRLRARLLRSDSSSLAEHTAAFGILALRHVALDIASLTPAPRSGSSVQLRSALHFLQGNALLQNATLRASVHGSDGAQVWSATQTLGVLQPGYELQREDSWDTTAAAAGVYTLRLTLSAPDFEQEASSSLQLAGAVSDPVRLSGSLTLAPGARLIAGQDGALRYRLVNEGSAALSTLQLRLRLYQSPQQPALLDREETLDLAAGAAYEGSVALLAPPLQLQSHVALLEARAAGDAAGQWRLLASQGFDAVDALPPQIGVLAPGSALQPAIVPLRARITDAHSAIAEARLRIDGGAWQPLSRGSDGLFTRHLGGLADGAHQVEFSARDSWGNETFSPAQSFTVDALPPQIIISGIGEGQLANHDLSAAVSISDANLDPAQTSIHLDGQPYVPGTPIQAEGEHVLGIRALDLAGNQSLAAHHFRIDRTPPPLLITGPADGAVVAESRVAVQVLSEAGAAVTLDTGAYSAQQVATGGGIAEFAGVPLAEGDNRIEAVARDAAGNASPVAAITVRYESAAAQPLVGTLQPAAAEVAHGQPLQLTLRLRNPGAVALPAQSLRLDVLGPAAQLLQRREYQRVFAAGEEFSEMPEFATTEWPLGLLMLRLEILRDGSWIMLDSQSITLADRTAPQLQAIAPAAGSVLRAPLRLRASAHDALSAPVSAEYSLDEGLWQELSAAGGDSFESAPLKLADGDHSYRLRARDAAGNLAEGAATGFAVDTTAPLITLSGVADGDLLNHAVTPLIGIDEAHPASSSIRLDGQPFVSGSAVSIDGEHLLQVEATDAAGNSATAQLRFTLDLQAPAVSVSEPVPGSTVTLAQQEVAGSTEPLASVHIQAPGLVTTVQADAQGRFRSAAATLQPGLNTLRLYAIDRAGNTGAEITADVTYQPSQAQSASAQWLDTDLLVRRGDPLQVRYLLRNTGTVALAATPLRVELRTLDGDVLAQDEYALDLGVNAETTRSSLFPTGTLRYGEYRVALAAQLRDAAGTLQWVALGTTSARISGCPYRRPADAVFWNGFEPPGTEDGLFCDDFDFPPPVVAAASRRSVEGTARKQP
ncbi:CARDB domain-containing protein [Tahibacter harae]|uniref:Ig-like domain-containing protein n=1 Tax=Tahibacter harae TaxID=2963937 RepID=A0ABT1QNN4_9GAMM|nr:CARDB domain-containing protein [Tahibacter harae]MCQ4163760.1 Ig-like domain-containing protein [Tahibacter harae]